MGTGFDSKFYQIDDLAHWVLILEQGEFAYLKEPLGTFRMNSSQQTKIIQKICVYLRCMEIAQKKKNYFFDGERQN